MGMREEEFEAWLLDYTDGEGAPGTMRVVMKHAWQAATLQAAERMKEEAVANARAALRHGKGYADVAEQAIRAIDVNKLFEKGEDDQA